MKLLFVVSFVVLGASTCSSFSAVPIGPHVKQTATTTTSLFLSDIMGALSTLEGPSICWGPEGTLIGHNEPDVKEYDNFTAIKAALEQTGIARTLKGLGPYTLLAPVDTACEAFAGQIDEDILKYHIVLGDVFSDEITGKLETLSGHFLTCRHEFRKNFVDDALIGQADNHTGGSKYPTDVQCENGIIHAINLVLVPGYSAAGAEDGPVSRRQETFQM